MHWLPLLAFATALSWAADPPRAVWTGFGASHLGAPSPDGRFLSGIHPESGELLLRDLNSGIRRRIGGKTQAYEFASYSVFSPDSKLIAYAWSNADRRYELRIASVDSLAERTLFLNDGAGIVQPCAFSPDSKHILALLIRPEGDARIVFIAAETGAVKIVKTLPGPKPRRIDLSPDGRLIAWGSTLLTVDGTQRDEPLVKGFAGDLSPVFSRDGRFVYFSSDLEGAPALWRVALADRKPVLLRAAMPRFLLQGITAGGRLFLGLRPGGGNIYRAGFDASTGKLTSPAQPVGEDSAAKEDWAQVFPAATPSLAPSGGFRAEGNQLWRTGGSGPVATFPRAITAIAAAPDGDTVAVAQSTTLTVLSTKGRIESRAASETISGLFWAPGGRNLVTVQNDSLWWWEVAAATTLAPRSRIVKMPASIGSASLDARTSSIAFTAGRPRSEVWTIDSDAR